MSGFHIDTWTVQIVAICRMRVGWNVDGGTDGTGAAPFTATPAWERPFSLARIRARSGTPLIRVGVLRPRPITGRNGTEYPAAFSGKVGVGRYGPAIGHDVRLDAGSFALRLVTSCPAASSDERP